MFNAFKANTLIAFTSVVLLLSSCNFSKETSESQPVTPPAPAPDAFTLSISNGTYNSGDVIQLELSFPKTLTVDESLGTPYLDFDLGGTTVNAGYVSGSGSSTIVFEYTVSNGQVDDDGVAPTGNITLNGGVISTVDGDTPTTYSVPNTSGVLVDAQVPSISSISINNGLYYFGEVLSFTVSYDEEVSVDESGGTPRLVLNIGGTTKYADYSEGSGSQNLVFTYTVGGSDIDSDGILLGSPIDANGGSIEDAGANSADLTFISPDLSSVTVNGDIPVVTSSTIPSAGTYYNGQDLDFTLTFSEDITVGGTPRLVLNIGGTTRYADYDIANSTSNTMAFKHSIVAGDTDSDGIAIATTIDLAGGSISDGANNAILTINLDGSAINVDYSNPQVTITTPVSNINIDNKSSYSVSGTCSEQSRDVVVVIGSETVSPNPTCSASNTWSVSGFDASGQDDSLTFNITADHSDAYGNNATQATESIIKDTEAPTITITSAPAISSSNEDAYSVGGTCSENSLDVSVSVGSVSGTATCTSNTFTVSLNVSGLDDGSISVTADHADAVGNDASQATTTVNKDTSELAVALTTPGDNSFININNNSTTFSIAGTCNDANATYVVEVGGSPITQNSVACDGTNLSGTIDTDALAQGVHSFTVVATDQSNNEVTSSANSVEKDTVAPTASISSAPTIVINNETSYTVSGACSENDQSVGLDVGGVTGSATCTTLTYSITVNTISVTDTSVAVEISHSDEAGNSVTDSTTVVKDVDAPLVAITSAQNILIANESTYTVGGTCSGSTENVSVSIGGIAVTAACDGTNWTTASTDVSGLDDGSVSITADLSDSNGNEAVQATASVTKDSDGPSVTNIVLDTSDGVYPSGTVQVTVTFSEDATFNTAGGTPSIALTIGSNARTMTYTSQPTTTTAIFSYSIGNDIDLDGLAIGTQIDLNGGLIEDSIGNTGGDLTFTAPDASGIYVTPAGLVTWLDAGDSANLYSDSSCTTNVATNGDSVQCWADKSGNGNHAVQATVGKSPVYTTNAINGSSVLTFDGSDDYLNTATTNTVRVVIVVFKSQNLTGVPQLYGSYSDGGHVALDAVNHYFSFNGNGNGQASRAKFLMDNDTAFSGWILDSDNGDSMWTDSTAHIVYNQFKSNSGVSMSNQTIGAEDFSGTNSLNGEVAEIMVFDGALQNTDRDNVMSYLKTKYGI